MRTATELAQMIADQELEGCIAWVTNTRAYEMTPGALRTARRPKPPNLKEQAMKALNYVREGAETVNDLDTIRRALEALPE